MRPFKVTFKIQGQSGTYKAQRVCYADKDTPAARTAWLAQERSIRKTQKVSIDEVS